MIGEHNRLAAWLVVARPDGTLVLVARNARRSIPANWRLVSSHRTKLAALDRLRRSEGG